MENIIKNQIFKSPKKYDIDCNKSNNELTNDEWNRIEKICINKKHLNCNSNLQEIIEKDIKEIEKYDITIETIKKILNKIEIHIKSSIKLKNDEDDILYVKKILNKKKININGWKLLKLEKCKIFKNTILVFTLTWGGAELCGFQSQHDKKYHGYDYGLRDYIFIKENKALHIGSLLFHSILKHDFFQDTCSPFRVYPDKLIKFFDIKPNINYDTDYKEDKYINYVSQVCSSRISDKINFDHYYIIEYNKYLVLKNKEIFDVRVIFKENVQDEYIECLDGRLYRDGFLTKEDFIKGMEYFIHMKEEVINKYATKEELEKDW